MKGTMMAKGKGAEGGDGEATDKVKPSDTLVLISEKTLRALLKSDDGRKEEIDGLVGELREEISNAVEKKHLDKGAYALLKKFHRMKSNEKLANLWDTLNAYMDMAGVMKRIQSVAKLPLDSEKSEAAAEPESEASAEVVRGAFGTGRSGAPAH